MERASLEDERRVLTTLAGLAAAVEGLDGPAMLIVGETAAMADVRPAVRAQAAPEAIEGGCV